MSRLVTIITLIGATTLAASACGAGAGDLSASKERELSRRLEALWSEVGLLREDAPRRRLETQRAAEIRALVGDVLADADTRAGLLENTAVSGYDRGFFIASADGNFRLRINGRLQYRLVYNHQDDGGEDDDRWGFENRRFRMSFRGHVFDPSWRYKIGGAFDRDGGVFETSDVYLEKDLGDGWAVRAGQFKGPFLREFLQSAFRQLAADRSLVHAAFGQGRSDGVQLSREGERVAFFLLAGDGFGNDDTAALEEETEFALTGRIEWLAAGDWKQFRDYTSWSDEGFALMLGAAAHYEKDEYGTVAGPEEETFTWTIDVGAEFGGAGCFAALVGRHLDVAGRDQYGLVVQGNVFLSPDEWECFARYAWGDDDRPGDELSVLTVGLNRYFSGHDLKLTIDLGYAFNAVGDLWASSGAGWRADASARDGQTVLRTQFQLLF
ncbi:MAG: porin [Planctomycetota bacterium]|nr:porin [Planctomycetota bacterium]